MTVPEQHLHTLPKGHRIEEYEIIRVLGAGSFGITYLAFDHQLDRPVALKEYFPAGIAARAGNQRVTVASTENRDLFARGLDRFISEARAIYKFQHPNVVHAHRYVKAHDTTYIVMEYVEGESLAALLAARGSLPADTWRPWLDRLLDGLAHIHEHGYLHRDIKPGNVVIRAADGEPVLIDFGAARVAAAERTHTQVLTPEYAPIEQHASQGAQQGPPTDIYALAAVSYRVLTGAPPPSAPDRVLEDRYEPLAGSNTAAERRWLAAIDRGLALRPEDRPPTVAAWRAAWRGVGDASGPGVGALQPAETEPTMVLDAPAAGRSTRKRDPADATATPGASVALAAIVIVAIVVFIARSTLPDPTPAAPAAAALPPAPAAASATPPGARLSPASPLPPAPQRQPVNADPTSGKSPTTGAPDEPTATPSDHAPPDPAAVAARAKAARAGDAQTLVKLRETAGQEDAERQPGLLMCGTGIWPSYTQVIAGFLKNAEEERVAEAQFDLGWTLAFVDGVENYAEAVSWFRKAAGRGHAEAQYNLGIMYANGKGVPRDPVLAYMWFHVSGANGHDNEQVGRREIKNTMTPFQIEDATHRARVCRESNYRNCDRDPSPAAASTTGLVSYEYRPPDGNGT